MTQPPNPFYVLELAPDCSRAEVERAGQKLLAMLELELKGAGHYDTPHGRERRDAASVREAMAELRDPQRRLFHELWAQPKPWAPAVIVHRPNLDSVRERDNADASSGFGAARVALGWR